MYDKIVFQHLGQAQRAATLKIHPAPGRVFYVLMWCGIKDTGRMKVWDKRLAADHVFVILFTEN